ncbi:MAG: hypothetical protein DRJ65_05175, partial [Acidobacteria bacterium]
ITNGHDLAVTGDLANAGGVTVGNTSTLTVNGNFTQTAGRTTLENGTLAASLFDLGGGELVGSGTIDADLDSAGTISPGASPGHIVVTGAHTETASDLLTIELSGPGSGEFDLLEVGGTAALAGELAVSLLDAFTPAAGANFDILTASSVSQAFAATNLPLVYSGGCLKGVYPGDRVRLTAIAGVGVTASPESQEICPGDPVLFTVGATGGETLFFQWRKGGTEIPGATSSSYSIAAVAAGDEGLYDVIVSNLCGSVASQAAQLTLGYTPVITVDPAGQEAYAGQPVKFAVEVDAVPAPSIYQWRKNGGDLPGETDSSLVLSDITGADEGEYDVEVSNDCGSETSAVATLTVVEAPTATTGRSFCTAPDEGLGQAEVPPALCQYLSPTPADIFLIVDGLPPTTEIEAVPVLSEFVCVGTPCGSPGGALGGEVELFDSLLRLHMTGTGDLAGFSRIINIPVGCETHSGPRMPGDDVQTFAADLYSLEGLVLGDPDFDHLEIRAGTGLGLPSPGQTILTRRAGASFAVDRFFDISYEIDFVGAPGGALHGLSGTTAGVARIAVTAPPMPMDPCVVLDNGGTAELPPEGCHFVSPDEKIVITDGLPVGTTIEFEPVQHSFSCQSTPCGQPGGSLGGEVELYDSTLDLVVTGTGTLAGFERLITLAPSSETHSGPRTPGDPVQHFLVLTESLQANLVGAPDFASLVLTAGNASSLPSPGMTTLTDQTDGTFVVDSFFDITYQIDFVGAPGSVLDGFSGSSVGRVGMTAINPPLFADGFESGDFSGWSTVAP